MITILNYPLSMTSKNTGKVFNFKKSQEIRKKLRRQNIKKVNRSDGTPVVDNVATAKFLKNLLKKNRGIENSILNNNIYKVKSYYATKSNETFLQDLANQIENLEIELQNETTKGEVNSLKYGIKHEILHKNNMTLVRILPLYKSVKKKVKQGFPNYVERIEANKKQIVMPLSTTHRNKTFGGLIVRTTSNELNHAATINLKNNLPRKRVTVLFSPLISTQQILHAHALGTPIDRKLSGPSKLVSFGNNVFLTNKMVKDSHLPSSYSFNHCFINENGFICCNKFLEFLMKRSYKKLKMENNFHDCNVHKIANRLQRDCEKMFNASFEVIVGIDDFALKAHFAGDLMCKIEQDGRFIVAYAISTSNHK
uniref:Ground-like domain-containing protein n=1 Tax=Heterorhabditis bacteriophora TaxID=37862 RepID=A0A1I7WB36_HETBA